MAAASQNKKLSKPERYRIRVETRTGGGYNVNLQWLKLNAEGDPVWVLARCLAFEPVRRNAVRIKGEMAAELGIDPNR
jgi:hypothetical protein